MTTTRTGCSSARRRRVERARKAGRAFWDKICADADRVAFAPFPEYVRSGSASPAPRLRRTAVEIPCLARPSAGPARNRRRSIVSGPERDYLAGLLLDCRPARTAPGYLFEELCERLGRRPELTEQMRGITASLAGLHGSMAAARCALGLIDLLVAPFPYEFRTDAAL